MAHARRSHDFSLQRSELVALLNTMGRLSDSVEYIRLFRERVRRAQRTATVEPSAAPSAELPAEDAAVGAQVRDRVAAAPPQWLAAAGVGSAVAVVVLLASCRRRPAAPSAAKAKAT